MSRAVRSVAYLEILAGLEDADRDLAALEAPRRRHALVAAGIAVLGVLAIALSAIGARA